MFVETDEELKELHALAAKIGLKRAWFQDDARLPHYDLNAGRRAAAVKAGAVEVTLHRMIEVVKKRRTAVKQKGDGNESEGSQAVAEK